MTVFVRLLAAALALLLAWPPALAAPANPAGRWALHADGKTLLILELERDARAPGGWSGRLVRPTSAELTDNHIFSSIQGPVVRRPIRRGRDVGNGLELLVEGTRRGDTDAYLFRVAEDGFGELGFKNVDMAPFILVPAQAGEAVADDWDPARAYPADRERPPEAWSKAR
jgi:hypothetical protein